MSLTLMRGQPYSLVIDVDTLLEILLAMCALLLLEFVSLLRKKYVRFDLALVLF